MIEKLDQSINQSDSLPVMETFHSIQGEGFHQGTAAWFIRLGGCDVGCTWCDVKESWEAGDHPIVTVAHLVKEAQRSNAEIVILTGGEPVMYDLTSLTAELKIQGLRTHLETSGVYPLTGTWDWICLSPKKFKAPLDEYYPVASELKVVVYHPSDLAWAEKLAAHVGADCMCYLQPEWSKEKIMLPLIIDYVKANPRWKISLQIHKYMHIR